MKRFCFCVSFMLLMVCVFQSCNNDDVLLSSEETELTMDDVIQMYLDAGFQIDSTATPKGDTFATPEEYLEFLNEWKAKQDTIGSYLFEGENEELVTRAGPFDMKVTWRGTKEAECLCAYDGVTITYVGKSNNDYYPEKPHFEYTNVSILSSYDNVKLEPINVSHYEYTHEIILNLKLTYRVSVSYNGLTIFERRVLKMYRFKLYYTRFQFEASRTD